MNSKILHDGTARVLVPMTAQQLEDAARNATSFADQERFLMALALIDDLRAEWVRADLRS